ncbi:hypothetical protein BLNAU_25143 [Blattamonas nauphoetae]|uniref:Uncharacterized protein n=1 Tax=Blattamonas nauphoetae TaxID=2049346 RepID=A0ABQ9WKE9_9EUKA|nr:hypothetical protein BLNAU_25143 [Blattamonas nauphoetae]
MTAMPAHLDLSSSLLVVPHARTSSSQTTPPTRKCVLVHRSDKSVRRRCSHVPRRTQRLSIVADNQFPSLPIRLTAVESLLPDSPARLVSIGVTRKAFVSWTHQISPLVLVWPPTAEFMRDWSVPPDEPDRSPPFPPHSLLPHIFS